MTLEALASAKLPSFLICDPVTVTPLHHAAPSPSAGSFLFDNVGCDAAVADLLGIGSSPSGASGGFSEAKAAVGAGQGRKKRRRTRACQNKEAAENQRMTHIAVERNRRRQMNEHLAVLRSLMPESYIQRGDQASIVGGAIDFVKELEQLLQSLEVQKRTLQQQQAGNSERIPSTATAGSGSSSSCSRKTDGVASPPFAQFFPFPQYSWCHTTAQDQPPPPALADIEVTLIETHANVRILSPKRPGQLLKMVAGLQSLRLAILHLNVTSLDSMVLYSLSVKVEEGCNLTTVDNIAAAIHHMLSLIESEVTAAAHLGKSWATLEFSKSRQEWP